MDIEYEVNIMATEIKAPSTVASPQWPARNEPELYHDLMSPAAFEDNGVAFPEPEAGMAKYYATNLSGDFAREAVQIFGGYGYMRELTHDSSHYHVGEIYRDA